MKTGFVYKWTNAVNGKWYIGSHMGNTADGYLANGKIIKQAFSKYGLGSFSREILYQGPFFREEEERYLTEVDARSSPESYNLKNTSEGGGVKGSIPWNKGKPGTFLGKNHTQETKDKLSILKKELFQNRTGTMSGRTHTSASRQKMRGENQHNHVLSEEQVREIKQTLQEGGDWGYKSRLARKHNIHPNTLLDIEKNRTWRWVT